MFGFLEIYHIQWMSLDLTIKISALLHGKVERNFKFLLAALLITISFTQGFTYRQENILVNIIFLINLFFNWRIMSLQNFVVFCQTSTWISHRYIYIPFLLNLPPISQPSRPSRLIQSPCLSSLLHTTNSCWLSILHMFPCYSLHTSHPLLPSPHVHNLFSMSVSPLLTCK